jgi:repressor LexA
MQPLTPKQKQIFDFISHYIEENGYAPSYREIGDHFAFTSLATVFQYIEVLKQKQYLTGEENLARSIQLTPAFDERTFEIPLWGTISAGHPIEAIRTKEAIEVPRDMMGKDVFALKVRGDSMIEDGINDGDYVIVQKVVKPQNGDIVIALVDGDNVTLKRFYKEKKTIRLQPANRSYKPIRTKKVIIQGKVKGVLRKFR